MLLELLWAELPSVRTAAVAGAVSQWAGSWQGKGPHRADRPQADPQLWGNRAEKAGRASLTVWEVSGFTPQGGASWLHLKLLRLPNLLG